MAPGEGFDIKKHRDQQICFVIVCYCLFVIVVGIICCFNLFVFLFFIFEKGRIGWSNRTNVDTSFYFVDVFGWSRTHNGDKIGGLHSQATAVTIS